MKTVLIISILFASVISVYYVPMKKDHELGEHICRYEINDTSNIYVKPCEEGKYCQKTVQKTGGRNIEGWEYLYTCQNYTQKLFNLKQLDEACTSNSECDSGLTCEDQKCVLNCGTDRVAYRSNDGWSCTTKKLKENNYYYYKNFEDDLTQSGYSPYFTYPGKITFHKSNNYYQVEIIENAYFASLEDGTFVSDEKTCKSGYYLYFYPDGTLKDPYTGNDGKKNSLYKMCVSLEEVNRYTDNNCQIIYSINNQNKTYNLFQYIPIYLEDPEHTLESEEEIEEFLNENCPTNILEKKLFKKYSEAMTDEKRTKCNNLENYNHITCNDDELTKWYYFYNHPDIYSLYYTDEEDDKYKYVVKHLIQVDYPYYQVGNILNVKNSIILLLLLLSILI